MTKYTLEQIKDNPKLLTYEILRDNDVFTLRPLESDDVEILTKFLEGLSPETRKNYKLDDYGIKTAKDFCSTIAVYDKLRFILVSDNNVVGLFEFSMEIPESDMKRLSRYKTKYISKQMCRFGPCLADNQQGKGIASMVMPYIKDIAIKTGNKSILLWGGVFQDNIKAVKYYNKVGFENLGQFLNQDGEKCFDMVLNL